MMKRNLGLYVTLAGVLVGAAALTALLVLPPRWPDRAGTPTRFLGLDEPVEKTPPGK
jgi:hypothetical protein